MKIKHPATYGALTAWVLILIVASGTYQVGATPPIIAGRFDSVSGIPNAEPSAGTTLRIDAGSTTDYIDVAGNLWVADTGYVGGNARGRYTMPISGTPDDRIYQTERYAMSAYLLPVANGRYTVRLHFAEDNRNLGTIGARVFDAIVEGQPLRDIDVFAEAGALYKALVRSVDVTVKDQQLDIQFISKVNNPQIKGIEVLPLEGSPNPTETPTRTPSPTPSATPTRTATPSATPTPKGPGRAPPGKIYLPVVMKAPVAPPLPPCGDREDDDDTPEGATQLRLGSTCLGSVDGDGVNGDDWLYVNVAAGRTLVVDLANMPANADYDLFVFDEQLKDGESNPVVGSNGPEHVEIPLRAAGKYYIRVVVYMVAPGPNIYSVRAAIR